MKVQFYLRFKTSFGQSLWISTNGELGADQINKAIPMKYLNEEYWVADLKIENEKLSDFKYKYILKNNDDEIVPEDRNDRCLEIKKKDAKECMLIDTWNHAGEYENAFYSAPFSNILLNHSSKRKAKSVSKKFTHIFKIKAPLLNKDEVVCVTGNTVSFSKWSVEDPILLSKHDSWWKVRLDLSADQFPISYKYGIYNTKLRKLIHHESGNNRILHADLSKKRIVILHDGFIRFPNNTWKGSGVAIPVFSLRSKKSFGIGEFNDLKLLADWAKNIGLKLIQILPVNDTTATHSKHDSYPYAAISAFAMHPIYIHLEKVAGQKFKPVIKKFAAKKKELNDLADLDYTEVMKCKMEALKEMFEAGAHEDLKTEEFSSFFNINKHWLIPYAAFSFLRDKYKTADCTQWNSNREFKKKHIEQLVDKDASDYKDISFHYFIQFHLHKQLKEAADYLHKKGIVLKGDIPIGIYRYGCDAWVDPTLYNLDWQAGAPPDDFAVKGQNWGFPTYNWKKMQENHFEWWRKRFEQMSSYFDAFRVDHILGFFRIWSIPTNAIEGVMGRFVPEIPVSLKEFGEQGIWFDYQRYCSPFITDEIINSFFGTESARVIDGFLTQNSNGLYDLKPQFDTQRKVEKHFSALEETAENTKLKTNLFDLISNVILFDDHGTKGKKFHFRIAMENTSSFQALDHELQQKLKVLYINYFYHRQDDFWMKEAMHKLPYLKRATNMLICGEDLGMVPHCVPDVMQQLGILSLEIQRMPKQPGLIFSHPKDAPYLSVITPSTHDMSTIRGWWEEDKEKINNFFHYILEQKGDAPYYCEPWINRAIVLQHLYSPAMWCIFQLQDILGMNEKLRRENPLEERINVPADPNNIWKYRMHLNLESLKNEKEFTEELKTYITQSGRA